MRRQTAFVNPAPMLKGALHCHTTRSDGAGSPEDVIRKSPIISGICACPSWMKRGGGLGATQFLFTDKMSLFSKNGAKRGIKSRNK
jgi:hypothetical protein